MLILSIDFYLIPTLYLFSVFCLKTLQIKFLLLTFIRWDNDILGRAWRQFLSVLFIHFLKQNQRINYYLVNAIERIPF